MAELSFFEATGNRFAVIDGFVSAEPESAVRRVLSSSLMTDENLDGVLICGPSRAGADCRMDIFNRDGSRAEACGNGLRCVARFAFERGRVGERLRIETAVGLRTVLVLRDESGAIRSFRTGMGRPRIVEEQDLSLGAMSVRAAIVDMGNQHCVLFVEDVPAIPVKTLGPLLERHVLFAKRTNVGFARVQSNGIELRVWERGVGETAACGTGAAAAAAVALRRGLVVTPLEVRMAGGVLNVHWDGESELFLEGPAEPIAAPTAIGF